MTIVVGSVPRRRNLASIRDELGESSDFVRVLLLNVVAQDEDLAIAVLTLAVKHCVADEQKAAQAALVLLWLVMLASRGM